MQVVTTIAEVRAARRKFPELGLVPTMGYLHAGHISLVDQAKRDCGAVAVSIFVNPTQFGPGEDLARYPRDLARDLSLLKAAGTDLVFTPEPTEIYPPGCATRIDVGRVGTHLEGAARPGHFAGVATVVAKLFNIFQPTRAYFGQKDAQQTVVIRHMTRDLDLPVQVVVAPTVREADGLAMSSRNIYLTAEQRAAAPALYCALVEARRRFDDGERNASRIRRAMQAVLSGRPEIAMDYVSVADPETLEELDDIAGPALASLAARLGSSRLIDNVVLEPRSDAGGEAGANKVGDARCR
ncbi:MAG TPA: pantoate--beta-alanine ligase [Acetobacteraceae bacterium]|nr:pantoate--beta-alanine ligase [Acetobacteraceae bacterium]